MDPKWLREKHCSPTTHACAHESLPSMHVHVYSSPLPPRPPHPLSPTRFSLSAACTVPTFGWSQLYFAILFHRFGQHLHRQLSNPTERSQLPLFPLSLLLLIETPTLLCFPCCQTTANKICPTGRVIKKMEACSQLMQKSPFCSSVTPATVPMLVMAQYGSRCTFHQRPLLQRETLLWPRRR